MRLGDGSRFLAVPGSHNPCGLCGSWFTRFGVSDGSGSSVSPGSCGSAVRPVRGSCVVFWLDFGVQNRGALGP